MKRNKYPPWGEKKELLVEIVTPQKLLSFKHW